ncbi:MAG TPA: amino acid ABC transporter substrate-binding protein [Stellaceae bacterium]|nr:amino acid ABC transporter substrate-binding protein [Stellaceae bacterium]
MLHHRVIAAMALACTALAAPSWSAEPIKLGFSAELTGELALNGKQELVALQIWQQDINAKGGLLGRQVQLRYFDDQSNPALVPGIYAKLLDIDHVDLLFAQGTNISTPAMPSVIEHNMVLMDSFAIAVNERFHYPRFFQIMPYGPNGKDSISHGFFDAAMTMQPKPASVALVGADAEFSRAVLEGARANAQRVGLKLVYDRTYPPATIDYTPIIRAIKAAAPDIVYVGSYPADTAGVLRALDEVGLVPRMFGGGMVGLQAGEIKERFGEQLNGIVGYELFVHEPTMSFPGIDAFLATYQARAVAAAVDPLGYYIPPFTYAAAEILAQAVQAVGSLDQDKIAQQIHQATFHTIVGDVKFGPEGEWATARILTIQYRGIHGHDLQQFTRPGIQVILDPPQFKSGSLEYPFSEFRH